MCCRVEVLWVKGRSVKDVDWGARRISVISWSGRNIFGHSTGTSEMTIRGPLRMEASAFMYVPGYIFRCSFYYFKFRIDYISWLVCLLFYVCSSQGVASRRRSSLFARYWFVCSLWAALIAYCRQFPSPMTLMIDRLRVCAFVSRIELAAATWCAWLLYLRRRLCSLLPRWLLLSSSSILDSSSGSLVVCRCLVIVTGRVA